MKYREEQGLCLLDSMRQSGGEKSVATMLFLMALQHISQAPIRIVDEINQVWSLDFNLRRLGYG